MLPINWTPGDAQVRSFTRLWLPLFTIVAGALLWRRTGWSAGTIGVIVSGAVLALICVTSRAAGRAVFLALQVVTFPVAAVVSTVVLAFVFYLVLTPIGLVLRATGRDPLRLRARQASTHWLPVRQNDDPERAFRQF